MPTSSEDIRLRAVLDTVVDGVILIDSRGIVQMFNPACEKLFSYPASEVIGQNVKMLMPAPYRDAHDGYLANYRETGVRRIIGIGREVVGRRKDGTTFPMDLSVGEASLDEGVVFVGIIHDLTERKRSEQALTESADRLRAVIDTAVDGVILIDAEGTVQRFNPACEKLFGYPASEVVGQNVKMLMPAPYRDAHDGYLANYRETGVRRIIGIGREVVGRRKDGTTFPMDLSVGEAEQDGKPIFVGVIHDLTDRKRAEEQLIQAQKMEVVGQLSGGIAHDFNNLLTVILGNAEFLRDAVKVRPDLERIAASVISAAERGAELTSRLLSFGRRQTLQPAQIDGNLLVDGVKTLLRRTLREDIAIRTDLDRSLWPIFADPGQLESAILNLALNAKDAMPSGGQLTIATSNVPLDERHRGIHPEVPPGNYVMVAVTDDGAGMPPEVLERVFEPFFTTKEVGKGSGLGLSMVHGFVNQSNGHVTIVSEQGLGTTVRLYLPAVVDVPQCLAETPAFDRDTPRGNGVVLVAEDDPFVRAYAVASLESLGYRTLSAVNGYEALAILAKAEGVELLFSDVVMPGGMSGWELAERARKLRPNLKVLLTSGYAIETLVARGRSHPDLVVLNKPYRKADLAAHLGTMLVGPHGAGPGARAPAIELPQPPDPNR